jgi:ribonuclease HI
MVHEDALNVYVDGSSYPGPRRGGIGVLFVWVNEHGDEVVELDPQLGHKQATNNEMELSAAIAALRLAEAHRQIEAVRRVVIFTDSRYVVDNVSRALFQWSSHRWLNSHGRPIENADLWKELVRRIKKASKRVYFEWVKGHSKDLHNRAVDKAAKASAKGLLQPPLRVTTVRKKQSAGKVLIGSVPMRGQSLSIRIITDTYLRTQKVYKYKYEVLAGTGEHAGSVDLIFAEACLKAGHHYEIQVNTETRNPRIVAVLRELERTRPI